VKISHSEHGGNGESTGVVTQWLRRQPVDSRTVLAKLSPAIRHRWPFAAPLQDSTVAPNPQSDPIIDQERGILLTVQRGSRSVPTGAQKDFAMFETVTAFLGLVSVGIFLAHAFEGFRSRA
jgi:hypothetical protein